MKDASIFIDVDLTQVEANGQLLSGAREALTSFKDEGCFFSSGRLAVRIIAAKSQSSTD
jgi:hypothetical protein